MGVIGRILRVALVATVACDGGDAGSIPEAGGHAGHLFEDPPARSEPPASMSSFTIPSHDDTLLARVLVASGPGPHPQLLILHGFPGNENNFDMAHALRRVGWNVAVVHYRGAWGSSGQFTFEHVLEDVDVAIDHLTSAPVARSLRSEPGQIYVVGHSMGGFAALYSAARRDDVLGAASLAGFNFGASAKRVERDAAERRAVTAAFAQSLAPLKAPTAEALVREYVRAGSTWDLQELAPALMDVPILLVAGHTDQVAPPAVHHAPLVAALSATGHEALTVVELADGHGFSSSRITLTRRVRDWLDSVHADDGITP